MCRKVGVYVGIADKGNLQVAQDNGAELVVVNMYDNIGFAPCLEQFSGKKIVVLPENLSSGEVLMYVRRDSAGLARLGVSVLVVSLHSHIKFEAICQALEDCVPILREYNLRLLLLNSKRPGSCSFLKDILDASNKSLYGLAYDCLAERKRQEWAQQLFMERIVSPYARLIINPSKTVFLACPKADVVSYDYSDMRDVQEWRDGEKDAV